MNAIDFNPKQNNSSPSGVMRKDESSNDSSRTDQKAKTFISEFKWFFERLENSCTNNIWLHISGEHVETNGFKAIIENLASLSTISQTTKGLRFTDQGRINCKPLWKFFGSDEGLSKTCEKIENLEVFTRFVRFYFKNILIGNRRANLLSEPLEKAVEGLQRLKLAGFCKLESEKVQKNIERLEKVKKRILKNKEEIEKREEQSALELFKTITSKALSLKKNCSGDSIKETQELARELCNCEILKLFPKLKRDLRIFNTFKEFFYVYLAEIIWTVEDYDLKKIEDYVFEKIKENQELMRFNKPAWVEKSFPIFTRFIKQSRTHQVELGKVLKKKKKEIETLRKQFIIRFKQYTELKDVISLINLLADQIPVLSTVYPFLINREKEDIDKLLKDLMKKQWMTVVDEIPLKEGLELIQEAGRKNDEQFLEVLVEIIMQAEAQEISPKDH